MNSRLFESFCKLVQKVPPKAVLRAVQAERRMLEGDLAARRQVRTRELLSILAFCQFLEAAMTGNDQPGPIELPVDHFVFYRAVIERLVDAGEASSTVREDFEVNFFPQMMQLASSWA